MIRDQFNPFVISHCSRSPSLEEKFSEFNERFFNSRLPKYRVMLCTKSKNFGHEASGYCLTPSEGSGIILIREGMGEKSTEQTLVHEMIHAKLSQIKRKIHGARFISELRRLRKLGAPLSQGELDMPSQHGREPPRLTRASVSKLINYALDFEKIPASQIPKYLERELMLPYSLIDRIAQVDELMRRRAKSSRNSTAGASLPIAN